MEVFEVKFMAYYKSTKHLSPCEKWYLHIFSRGYLVKQMKISVSIRSVHLLISMLVAFTSAISNYRKHVQRLNLVRDDTQFKPFTKLDDSS